MRHDAPASLRSKKEEQTMQTRLIIHQEAESTQDLLKAMALSDKPEGVAVMALKQTSGRGRSGHTWISPAGKNLAISLLLRPRIPPDEIPLLGLMAAIAVAETVEAKGIFTSRTEMAQRRSRGREKIGWNSA